MSTRVSFLFSLTTTPVDLQAAVPHSAGWSESQWHVGTLPAADLRIKRLAQKRALLLPKQASIIGYRLGIYTLVGNKIVPTGSSTVKSVVPGVSSRVTDLPQVSLEMSGQGLAVPNANRFVLRGIPDTQMVQGEYQPDGTFDASVAQYIQRLILDDWSFIGRDLSQQKVDVVAINGAVVTLSDTSLYAAGDYLIFNRCRDDQDKPVKGSFRISSVDTVKTLTLQGMTGHNLTKANGTVRKDLLAQFSYAAVTPSRAVVRKVGRPFASYRGRQSRRS